MEQTDRRTDIHQTESRHTPTSRRRRHQLVAVDSTADRHACTSRWRRAPLDKTVGIAGARPSSLSAADRVSGERRRRMQLDNGTSRHARSPLTRPASRITSARAHGDSGTVSFAGARPSSLSAADRSRLHEQVHRRRVRHTPAPTMHLFVQAIRSAADRLVDTTDNVSVELQITTCLGSKR